jgi:hypothetical protein
MGRHSDPNRRDTNPLHGLFRRTEPGHTGGWNYQPTEKPAEPTGGEVRPHEPAEETALFRLDPEPVEPPAADRTEVIRIGRPPYLDPTPGIEPPADRPVWPKGWVERKIEVEREPEPRWKAALAAGVALCVGLAGGWGLAHVGRAEAVSVPLRPAQTITVTASASGGEVRPAVTAWRTRTPKPKTSVKVSRVPVPGPTVTTTRTVRPKPSVSVRVSIRPVPGPTCTETVDETGAPVRSSCP